MTESSAPVTRAGDLLATALARAAVAAIAALLALVGVPRAIAATGPAHATAATGLAPAGAAADTLRFSGVVHRGEVFRRGLPGGLEFRLTPIAGESDGAWSIGIWPADSVAIDYAAVATPPFRGVNARDIEGWHFRNADNTGPNRGDVNAPREEREFLFVETRAAHDSCEAALQRVMWPYQYADEVVDRASSMLDSLATGQGLLRIRDLALTPPIRDARADIDSMRFEVVISHSAPPR